MICHHYAERGGWRFVVLFHNGPKYVRLFDVSTFETYTITPRNLPGLRPYTAIKPKQLARRIEAQRRMFKRCGLSFPAQRVSKVISVLTA